MLSFDGYLEHELIEDLDDPGHLLVVSRWESREAADAALSYASHPNAMRVNGTGQRTSPPHARRRGVTDAGLIVALANAQAARRPAYARSAVRRDALADARAATELLEPLLGLPVTAGELPAVRASQRAVTAIVDAMTDGREAAARGAERARRPRAAGADAGVRFATGGCGQRSGPGLSQPPPRCWSP